MRHAFGVVLVLSALGACSAKSVGSMDPVEGGACSKNGTTAQLADGCTQCTCTAKAWSCQSNACEATTCTSGERKLADDGCNACKCNSKGAWVCTTGNACPGGDGGAPPSGASGGDSGGSGGAVEEMKAGSSGISGTDPQPIPVAGECSHALGTPPAPPRTGAIPGPCDIYAEDGGPCVAAHSTVRALYASYDGPLYQLRKTDGTTRDINPLVAGGFADSVGQDSFCAGATCQQYL